MFTIVCVCFFLIHDDFITTTQILLLPIYYYYTYTLYRGKCVFILALVSTMSDLAKNMSHEKLAMIDTVIDIEGM